MKNIIAFVALFYICVMCFAQNGAGLVIAVPSPQLKSEQKNDEWIPQFMQDSLTTNLARYSKMTVVDRANEKLTLAEQKISTYGQYDETTSIEIGKMTNAQYVLVGTIQFLSKQYSVNFRVNNIETNEIKASYQNNYTLAQIESGEAVQQVSKEIMIALGIELDDKALAELEKTTDKSISTNQNLAKGAAAEKNEDFIKALQYFTKVQEQGGNYMAKKEALISMQDMLTIKVPTNSIKARLEYGANQIAKWNKIFADLESYMINDDVPIIIYDFSDIKSDIKYNYSDASAKLDFTIGHGVKLFHNRSAMLVFKSVYDAWEKVIADKQNDWCKEVKLPTFLSENIRYGTKVGQYRLNFQVTITIYDEYSDKIIYGYKEWYLTLDPVADVLAQQKYYNNSQYIAFNFKNINATEITNSLNQKISKVTVGLYQYDKYDATWIGKQTREIHPRIFTVEEYEDWLAAGCP